VRSLKDILPLAISIIILWGLVAVVLSVSAQRNDGHLVYTLDDAYIHMAIAKNLVTHGVWGIGGDAFAPASSSILWTLLLSALYAIFGVNEWLPLAMNVLAASVLLWLLYVLLRRCGVARWSGGAAVVVIALLVPLVPVIFCGMEHLLQAVLVIAFVYQAAQNLAATDLPSESARTRFPFGLPLLSALLTMARLEDAFLVGVVCVMFAIHRKFLVALLIALAGALPICVHGFISLHHGWYFLPNAVLLKTSTPNLSSFPALMDLLGRTAFREIGRNLHLTVWLGLAVAGLIVLRRRSRTIWQVPSVMLLIFVAAMLLHVQFARVGHFFRYDMYLVVLGAFALAVAFWRELPAALWSGVRRGPWLRRIGLAALVLWMVVVLGSRAVNAHARIPRASRNIYHQHFQMGSFLNRFYDGQTIVANDIGAINYFADIECFDVWGLATRECCQRYRGHQLLRRHRVLRCLGSRDQGDDRAETGGSLQRPSCARACAAQGGQDCDHLR
jgi:hypothetical protein